MDAYEKLIRLITAHADNGASGEQIANAYHMIYRTFSGTERADLPVRVAHWIEARAEPGTVWADAYDILAA